MWMADAPPATVLPSPNCQLKVAWEFASVSATNVNCVPLSSPTPAGETDMDRTTGATTTGVGLGLGVLPPHPSPKAVTASRRPTLSGRITPPESRRLPRRGQLASTPKSNSVPAEAVPTPGVCAPVEWKKQYSRPGSRGPVTTR